MKVTRISHIAIAGNDSRLSRVLYEDILGLNDGGEETVVQEGVTTHFFDVGESSIEFLEPLGADTSVGKFLEKRGPGIHHLALEVEGLDDYIEKLKHAGIVLLSDTPQNGAHGMRIIFIHPKSTGGVLIELCERNRDQQTKDS